MAKSTKKTTATKKNNVKKVAVKEMVETNVPEVETMETIENQDIIIEEDARTITESENETTLSTDSYDGILDEIKNINITMNNFNKVIADMVEDAMRGMNEKIAEINNRLKDINDSIANRQQREEALNLLQEQVARLQQIEEDTNIEIEEVKKEVYDNGNNERQRVFNSSSSSWNGIRTT